MKTVPMNLNKGQWEYDFDTLESTITPKTKVLIITNPHNPTGKIFSLDELNRLTAILHKHPQVLVISDDVYYQLPFDGR